MKRYYTRNELVDESIPLGKLFLHSTDKYSYCCVCFKFTHEFYLSLKHSLYGAGNTIDLDSDKKLLAQRFNILNGCDYDSRFEPISNYELCNGLKGNILNYIANAYSHLYTTAKDSFNNY